MDIEQKSKATKIHVSANVHINNKVHDDMIGCFFGVLLLKTIELCKTIKCN